MSGPRAYKLVGRPPEAVLFHTAAGPVTARAFVAQAQAMAVELQGAQAVINLCQDRFRFAMTFAASIINRSMCWLVNDRSEGSLKSLKDRNPSAIVVDDGWNWPTGLDSADNPDIPADQIVATVFTSGSTGEPTGHLKHWGTLADRSMAAGERFGLTEDRPAAIVGTVPPQHMYGFETTVMQPWHAACGTWCGDSFYPADIQAALNALDAPRWLVTTPLQLRGMVRADVDLPPLQAVLSATAPMDPAVAQAAEDRWSTQVLEIFGATECGSIATRRTVADDHWTLYPGIHFATDAGAVSVQTPHAPACPIADRIEESPGGRFKVLGRLSDLIKIGGKRASLAGLNQILLSIDGVDDGAFVPPAEPEAATMDGGRQRMAVLAQSAALGPEQILAALRQRIDAVFLPRRVIMVEKMPRNDTGKLPRKVLDAMIEGTA